MRASELTLLVALSACTAGDDVHAPQVGSVTPDQAPAGGVVRVAGAYFCQVPVVAEDVPCDVSGSVLFGTVPGIPTLWTDTEIMVEVPEGLTMPVQLRVTAGGHTSNSVTFTPG
jgi:hypothetical protein